MPEADTWGVALAFPAVAETSGVALNVEALDALPVALPVSCTTVGVRVGEEGAVRVGTRVLAGEGVADADATALALALGQALGKAVAAGVLLTPPVRLCEGEVRGEVLAETLGEEDLVVEAEALARGDVLVKRVAAAEGVPSGPVGVP